MATVVLGGVRCRAIWNSTYLERAGGNPFFVEELSRALLRPGPFEEQDGRLSLVPTAAQRLPATLTEILLARLDRLRRR